MIRSVASLSVSNGAKRIVCVLVEPLGEDFWLAPGQTLTFALPDDRPTVDLYEEGASVWSTRVTRTT